MTKSVIKPKENKIDLIPYNKYKV